MLKSSLFLMSFLMLMSASAMAELGPVTKVEGADLVCCAVDGGCFAINSKDQKVWQQYPGMETGVELQVTDFKDLGGRYLFDISGVLGTYSGSLELRLQTQVPAGCPKDAAMTISEKTASGYEVIGNSLCTATRQ